MTADRAQVPEEILNAEHAAGISKASVSNLTFVVVLSGVICLCLLVYQAAICSPTSDERDHLAAGIATARIGDYGHYRVNPPLHRLCSGMPVEWWFKPQLDPIHAPSMMTRPRYLTYELGERLIEQNADEYGKLFIVGRLVRIPWILLGGICLASGLPRTLRKGGQVAAIFWFTSPFVLGHGWLIMPDGLSGVAAIFLITASLHWIENPGLPQTLLAGLAWGIAMSVKFTFCPLLVLWPLAILGARVFQWRGWRFELTRFGGGFFLQCWIALLIVVGAYDFSGVGHPWGQHNFQSHRLSWLNDDPPTGDDGADQPSLFVQRLRRLPSPFPKQFMLGIDDQQCDLEMGYPAYLLGTWYEGNAWWWFFPAYLLKEQVLVGILIVTTSTFYWVRTASCMRSWRFGASVDSRCTHETRSLASATCLCIIMATSVFLILALNGRMAIGARYLLPGVPAIYLALGLTVQRWLPLSRFAVAIAFTVVVLDLSLAMPHFFAYINPVGGGMYRIPAALHASNFDGGQDLWRLERWVTRQSVDEQARLRFCIHGRIPESVIGFDVRVPEPRFLEAFVTARRNGVRLETGESIVIMRGLAAPAPWNLMIGAPNDDELLRLIRELAEMEPDIFLSPTLAVYSSVETRESD